MDKKRLSAFNHGRAYQNRIVHTFNKKVHPMKLDEDDLILKELKASAYDPRGKLKPNWLGPYINKKLLSRGLLITWTYELEFKQQFNINRLQKHYTRNLSL